MLALVIAHPGLVRDGLTALLSATSGVEKIVQVEHADAAWDFMQSICPNIAIIHAPQLTSELTELISRVKKSYCQVPLLVLVTNEADRETAVSKGADIVILEGTPSSKLSAYITTLLQQSDISVAGNNHKLKEKNHE